VSHTDPVIVALRALGETAGSADDAEHAETCAHCRAELARLTEVVRLARAEGPAERPETPPPQVWDRIAAAVGTGPAPAVSAGNGASAAPAADGASAPARNGMSAPAAHAAGSRNSRRASRTGRRRGRLATALAGLAAGLIIGIGGTAGIAQLSKAPATRVVAQVQLSPLPEFPQWQGATGTAVMWATAGQQEIVITLHAPRRPGFYEAWLLARNGSA
jgi:hypothetical protein